MRQNGRGLGVTPGIRRTSVVMSSQGKPSRGVRRKTERGAKMDERWLQALGSMTYGIYVLTTHHEEKINGMIASWVSQISYDPPLVMVAVHPNRYSRQLIGIEFENIEELASHKKQHQANPTGSSGVICLGCGKSIPLEPSKAKYSGTLTCPNCRGSMTVVIEDGEVVIARLG